MVLWVVSTDWESSQTPVLISGTSLNLCLENRVHFIGEFPLAHDSIPQLILEKPQVILDTPDMLALLNRSRSASGIFLYLSITYYVVFS